MGIYKVGGVASRLKGRADAARGERRRVRLTLDQLLARKLHDHAVTRGGDEAVVLLGGHACHGLEPVGKVGTAKLDCPVLHRVGYYIRDSDVKGLSVFHRLSQRLVGRLRKPFLHNLVIEHHTAEQFGNHCHMNLSIPSLIAFFQAKQKGAGNLTAPAPLLCHCRYYNAVLKICQVVLQDFLSFLQFSQLNPRDTTIFRHRFETINKINCKLSLDNSCVIVL